MKHILDMCSDRGAYICQVNTNLWMKDLLIKINKYYFIVGKKVLKQVFIISELKQRKAPQQFTIEPDKKAEVEERRMFNVWFINYQY